MPQTYAQRVKLRPAYARYKNRKQTLRRRVNAGTLTPTQRAELQTEARTEYLTGVTAVAPPTWLQWAEQQVEAGVLANEQEGLALCNRACWFAEKSRCKCPCGGVNHGTRGQRGQGEGNHA